MADPTTPVVDYSYTGFQQEQQDTPFPGTQLDNDLAKLVQGFVSTNSAVADVRRSDGAVQNKSIGYDQLKDELDGFGFNPPTDWLTATNYTARDTVFHENSFYRAAVSHQSGVFADDLAGGDWVLIVDFTAATSDAEAAAAAAALDAIATAADRVQTGLDATATAADRVQTGLDATATAADRVQTGLDRDAAEAALATLAFDISEKPPFGMSGVRVLIGEENDGHYFGAGQVYYEDTGKLVFFFRRGSNHGTRNGGEFMAADSYDNGMSIENVRVLHSSPTHDARPGSITTMADGRVGVLVGRPSEASGALDPLFIWSEDQFETVTKVDVVRPVGGTAYSFITGQPLVNIPVDHPAVAGISGSFGPEAFVAYGSMNAGVSLDAAYTLDNGDTWDWKLDVTAALPAEILRYSESDAMELGGLRWLFYFRNKDAADEWRDEAVVCKTTNLFDWPAPFIDTGVLISASPPCVFVDHDTSMAYFLATSRKGFVNYGLENWALLFAADVDELWAADGDFGSVTGGQMQPIMPMPDWYTSYPFPTKIGDTWWFTATVGEINNADDSLLCWVGDFIASGAEQERWSYYLRDRVPTATSYTILADSNDTDDYPFKAYNRSETANAQFGAYGMSTSSSFTITQASAEFKWTTTGWLEFGKWRPYTGTGMTIGEAGDVATFGADVVTVSSFHGNLTAALAAAPAFMHIGVAGGSAALNLGHTGTGSLRTHTNHINSNGVVGTVTVTGTSTAFNTTSDETWKIFKGAYSPEEAARIIQADPVREFDWTPERGGGSAIGWGAQTSYGVSEDLASPGGWLDPVSGEEWEEGAHRWIDPIDETPWIKGGVRWVDPRDTSLRLESPETFMDEEDKETVTPQRVEARRIEAFYRPWGVDQSKRTPYLWAAMAGVLKRIEYLERKVAKLTAGV